MPIRQGGILASRASTWPRFHLATRPFLPQHDGAARIVAHDVERVLANIDADHGGDCALELLGHGVLLVFGAPSQHSIAGREGARPDHPINGLGGNYSITSSARLRIDGGTVRPRAVAVFRLTPSSKMADCWTGKSAGLAPLRIVPA